MSPSILYFLFGVDGYVHCTKSHLVYLPRLRKHAATMFVAHVNAFVGLPD